MSQVFLEPKKVNQLTAQAKKQQITIDNESLSNLQKSFALFTILIPFFGTILAICLLGQLGIGAVEIGLFSIMYALTMMGITVGFHRQFSHRSFETNKIVRAILVILGSMAAEGPVIHWVSNHRRHHQYSDRQGDPHSPHLAAGKMGGFWNAHIGWMLNGEITNSTLFAKDLLRDPLITKLNKLYFVWVILGLAIPSVLGGVMIGTWMGVLQGFLWGGLVRIFLVHHATWSINSITHLYGSSPFNTSESSKNNIWLAIPTGGEAWHNNHHAFPNSAIFGLEWWQIDLGGWVIRFLEKTGLVWDVRGVGRREKGEGSRED